MRSSDSARDRSAARALLSCRLRLSGRSAVFPQPVLFIRCPTFTFARAQHRLLRPIGLPHFPSGPCFFPDARKFLQVADFSPTLASRFLCLPVFPIGGSSHQKRVAQSGILHPEDRVTLKLWINVDKFSPRLHRQRSASRRRCEPPKIPIAIPDAPARRSAPRQPARSTGRSTPSPLHRSRPSPRLKIYCFRNKMMRRCRRFMQPPSICTG